MELDGGAHGRSSGRQVGKLQAWVSYQHWPWPSSLKPAFDWGVDPRSTFCLGQRCAAKPRGKAMREDTARSRSCLASRRETGLSCRAGQSFAAPVASRSASAPRQATAAGDWPWTVMSDTGRGVEPEIRTTRRAMLRRSQAYMDAESATGLAIPHQRGPRALRAMALACRTLFDIGGGCALVAAGARMQAGLRAGLDLLSRGGLLGGMQ
jgi:hypothetical protein